METWPDHRDIRMFVRLKYFPVQQTQEYLDSIPELVKISIKPAWKWIIERHGDNLDVYALRAIMGAYPGDFERKLEYRLIQYYVEQSE